MIFEASAPLILNPSVLDKYLESGWFRSGDCMFKSKFICIDGKISEIINIRLALSDYKIKKSHKRIINKFNNDNYKVVFGKACNSIEKERLYNLTKKKFRGFIVHSLSQFLFSDPADPVYNTCELNIYNGSRLIAASFFDIGKNSMASLLAIYDPEYEHLSTGKYTMLKEIQYCIDGKIEYYYPGYILDNNPIFDYKTFAGRMQYLNENALWDFFSGESRSKNSRIIGKKTAEISACLDKNRIRYIYKLNPFFTLGYIENFSDKFIKGMFIFLIDPKYSINYKFAIEYDVENEEYILSFINKTSAYNKFKEIQDNSYFENNDSYLTDIYIYDSFILRSKSINEIILNLINVKDIY